MERWVFRKMGKVEKMGKVVKMGKVEKMGKMGFKRWERWVSRQF